MEHGVNVGMWKFLQGNLHYWLETLSTAITENSNEAHWPRHQSTHVHQQMDGEKGSVYTMENYSALKRRKPHHLQQQPGGC